MRNTTAQAMAIANRFAVIRTKAKAASDAITDVNSDCRGSHVFITPEQEKILNEAIKVLRDMQETASMDNARIFAEKDIPNV